MKKKINILLSIFIGVLAFNSNIAYANYDNGEIEVEAISFDFEEEEFQIDLDNLDFSKPVSEEVVFINEDGELVTQGISFTPSISRNSSNSASVGTWRSWVNFGISNMSYRFDVTRSGTQWRISNARDHAYGGLFVTFANPRLSISRGTSTNTFPAEINASVRATRFNNQWVTISENTWTMRTTINSSGTMRLTHN